MCWERGRGAGPRSQRTRFGCSSRRVCDRGGIVGLRGGELAHGLVEGEAQDLGAEVDGVALQVALGPAPVTLFYDETGIGVDGEVAAAGFAEREAAFFQQRAQSAPEANTEKEKSD